MWETAGCGDTPTLLALLSLGEEAGEGGQG